MSNEHYDAGATIVNPNAVDLRLPITPQPILFLGGTAFDTEVETAIRRLFGEGELVSQPRPPECPKICIFKTLPDGKIALGVFLGIELCFRQHGNDAQVFQYFPIERNFMRRAHEHFVAERVENI